MEIVQLGLDDINRVFELSNQLENSDLTFEAFRPCFYEIVSLNNHIIYGVKQDTIVGYIHLRIERQLHHASLVVEVLELIIDDNFRNNKFLFQVQCKPSFSICKRLKKLIVSS